jgi:hypothetical protein
MSKSERLSFVMVVIVAPENRFGDNDGVPTSGQRDGSKRYG